MNTLAKAGIVIALLIAAAGIIALKNVPQSSPGAEATAVESSIPVPASASLPRLLDLGAGKCIPCKMMAPILEELKKEYAGQFEVVFLDVWENPQAAAQYGIRVIPTQIFFDSSGKELFRHEGFYSREDILNRWKTLGIPLKETAHENR
ncbi:MAG: thioredoxin family protein [Candidatus Omnitrophica bacterium]|nr:thioredoxin family protein [Candidatus Omnitrophota bacterium]